jgi:cardiolipin synthase
MPVPRPRAGSRLPPELHAARVTTLAAALPEGVRDPAFATLLSRIDRGPWHRGEQVDLFFDGEEAFAAMLAAVESARQEVLVESYNLRGDSTGAALLDALSRAVGRGAVVRVLADAFGSAATPSAFWTRMREQGIEVRLLHRLLPRWWFDLFRDHRKILVADRAVAFTGGMNIADDYGSSRRAPGGTWRDTQVAVRGTTAWELAVVFAEGWERAGGAPFEIPPLAAADGYGARTLVLDSRPARGHAETEAALAAVLAAARGEAWVTTPYFAPRRSILRALTQAAARGLDVRLLLPGRSDVRLMRHAGHGYVAELLAAGLRVFEYEAAVLHAKSMVVDGYVSVVGSTNLDVRSFVFNAECNVVVLDETVAAAMRAAFLRDLRRSRELQAASWRARGVVHAVADRGARLLAPFL